MTKPNIYTVRGAVEPLQAGKITQVRGHGNSMTPILKDGDVVKIAPPKREWAYWHDAPDDQKLKKGDIVLAKVAGRMYLHRVTAVKGFMVQIGNNHGRINGWTPLERVYGRMVKEGQTRSS